MPIYASSDESTEDGSFMSSDQQRHSDSSSVQTASSCPSEFLNDVDHGYRHPLLSVNTDNEQASHARRQFLGFDDSSLKDSTLNSGYNVYSPLSPTASEECIESNYRHLTLCSQHFHMLSVVLKIIHLQNICTQCLPTYMIYRKMMKPNWVSLGLNRIKRTAIQFHGIITQRYNYIIGTLCLLMITTCTVKWLWTIPNLK